MSAEITPGAVQQMYTEGKVTNNPVLQITEIKRIASSTAAPNAPPRFRLALSDGTHFQQAMIATQLNSIIADNHVKANALIRLKEIICNNVQGKRIVIILNLEMAGSLPYKVGNPVSIDVAAASGKPLEAASGAPNTAATTAGGAPGAGNPPQPQNQNQPPAQNQQFSTTGMSAPSFTNSVQATSGGPPNAPQGGGFGGGGGFGAARPNSAWQSNPAPNPFTRPGGASSGIIAKMPGGGDNGMYRPIQKINPYQNGWTIRGRCTFKSDMREFKNARGDGKVISFELTDDSGSIRITGFTNIADTIEQVVQPNRLYRVAGGYLKQANEKYNRSTSSFEMTIDQNALLEEAEDDGSVSRIKYNFVKIANLDSVPVKGNCDVVGVVTAVGPLGEIVVRSTNEPVKRRSITLTDDSNASVEITLWRRQAETFISEDAAASHPVLVVRNAMRGDFGGVSINVSRMTTLELNPVNVEEAHKLRAWFDGGGLNVATVQSVTSTGSGGGGGKIFGTRKSLADARAEDVDPIVNMDNGQATFVTRTILTHINTKNDIFYPSDPETKKKVVNQNDGTFHSESSGRTLQEHEVQWRYLISGKVSDHSGSHWVTGFDELGSIVFGRPAAEMRKMSETDRGMFEHIVDDALCRPLLLRVQAKERTWQDQKQIRYTAAKAEMVDYAAETEMMIKEIEAFGIA